jgi:hypothetical protein
MTTTRGHRLVLLECHRRRGSDMDKSEKAMVLFETVKRRMLDREDNAADRHIRLMGFPPQYSVWYEVGVLLLKAFVYLSNAARGWHAKHTTPLSARIG